MSKMPSPSALLPWKHQAGLSDCKSRDKWTLLGAPPCRCDTVTMPSCHVRQDRHLSRAGCAAPWLDMLSQNPPSSWQVLPVLLEMRTGKVCCLVGLAVSPPHSPCFEEMWEQCWWRRSCHALGYPWVKSRSACCLAGLPRQPPGEHPFPAAYANPDL